MMNFNLNKLNVFIYLVIFFFTSCQKGVVNVLCIGDSITQGKVEADSIKELSYRYWLWEKMDSAGYQVNMIGSNHRWFNQNPARLKIVKYSPYTHHSFINHHEAFYGIKTGETYIGGFTHDGIAYKALQERVLVYEKPDIAFIHIGSNDKNSDSVQTIVYLKEIIKTVYHRNNKVNIFLAKINTPWVKFVNHAVEPLIQELKSTYPAMKIHWVDMASGWVNCTENKQSMTFDWVHPNILGQKVMADKWFKAFKSLNDKEPPIFNPKIESTFLNDTTLHITWTKAKDDIYLAGYQVFINHRISNFGTDGCSKEKQSITLITDTNYTVTGVNKNNPYIIQIAALDFANNRSLSAETVLKGE